MATETIGATRPSDRTNWVRINRDLKSRWDVLSTELDSTTNPTDQARIAGQMTDIEVDFVERNDSLWRAATRKLRIDGADAEDMHQVARTTGWELFRTWNPDQADFPAYAKRYLVGAINRAVWAAEANGISYGTWTTRPAILHAAQDLTVQHGRAPTHQEVADTVGVSVATVEAVMVTRTSIHATNDDHDSPIDLPEPAATGAGSISVDDLSELTGLIDPSKIIDALRAIGGLDDVEQVAALTANLDTEATYVLLRRIGHLDTPATYDEIGNELGCSGEKIRRIEQRTIAILTTTH